MLEFLHVLERKQVLMEEMYGVFLESINLKKLNNLFTVILRPHGMNLKKWFSRQRNFIRVLSYLTK